MTRSLAMNLASGKFATSQGQGRRRSAVSLLLAVVTLMLLHAYSLLNTVTYACKHVRRIVLYTKIGYVSIGHSRTVVRTSI
jgi:hypothetical protein